MAHFVMKASHSVVDKFCSIVLKVSKATVMSFLSFFSFLHEDGFACDVAGISGECEEFSKFGK